MVFGLLVIFNDSATAQLPIQISSSNGSFKPMAGGEIQLAIHTKGSGAKATKSAYLKITTNGKYASGLFQIPNERSDEFIAILKKYGLDNLSVTLANVQNSVEIQGRDILVVTPADGKKLKFDVIRNNKSLGVMTFQY